MARTLDNIKKRHYRMLHRTPDTFSIPADAAAFATFLATFTELGYCRDKTLKSTIEPGEKEALDTGKKLTQGLNGKLEGILLQSEVADYTAVEVIEDIEQDTLFYSEISRMCIFFPNAILTFKEAVSSGETENIPFEYEAEDLANKATFRTRFDEPLV